MMTTEDLIENSIINSERSYAQALDLVIASAQQQLLIFDQDLSHGGYSSVKRYELLHDFLQQNTLSQLTIVLQNKRYFLEKCPRLISLLMSYGHKMTVYETNDHAKVAKDCFVLADNQHYCRRFHIDQARFKFALNNPEDTISLNLRFEELLQETSSKISTVNLGL